jgi:gliding motility-associated-like protein
MFWFITDSKINFVTFRLKSIIFLLVFLFIGFPIFSQIYQIDLNDGDTITTCSGTFYDSGGAGGNYGNNEDYTLTFCSDNGGTMGLDFTVFEVRSGDTLFIYDGTSTGSPLIGAYSGEGISFQVASIDTAITLNFKSNGIFNRAGWEATIECDLCIPPVTTPIFPADDTVCAGEIINYSVDDHSGSTYTWTIVNGTPASVVDGPNNIDVTWSFTGGLSGSVIVVEENSCGAKDSSFLALDIYDLPVVSFSGLASDYCEDDGPVTLTGNPVGGTFSGPGITGNQFDPVAAGIGAHSITYTYTNVEGCTDSDIQNTTVHVLPTVTFSGLNSLYDLNEAPVTLTGSPTGGTFSGNGIAGSTFNPGIAGVGIHEIIYNYSDAFGCAGADTQYTEVRNYDFRAGAKVITDVDNWCSADGAFSTIGATGDLSRGSCWANGPNYNRWFTFQATKSYVTVEVKVGGDDGTMQYPFLAIWDAANTQLGCASYTSQYSDIQASVTGLTAGTWYYISVDNYVGAGYRGTFTLCVDDTVSNDFKLGAYEISNTNNWCSGDGAYTTLYGTPDGVRPGCWSNGPNYNVWFKFQATTTGITIDLKTGGSEGTIQYPFIALWDQPGTLLSCTQYSSQYSDLTIGNSSLTPGQWYYVSVDNYTGAGYRGTFKLCFSDVVDYDFKAGAIELTDLNNWCSADAAYTTLNASADGNRGSCWNTGPNFTRWFRFQATTTEILVQLKTGGDEGTLQYPYISLLDSNNNELACARYSGQYSDLSVGNSSLTPGDWYYILVDNYNDVGYRGSFSLCVTDDIDYDFKAGAIELTDLNNWCSAEAAFTTMNASPDGLRGSCWNTGPTFDRWFMFQATTSEVLIQLKTGGSEGTIQYPYIALWDTMNVEVACARYFGQYSDLTIGASNLTPGEWYFITVDNYADVGYRGSFTLCISDEIDYNFKAGAIELTDLNNWCSAEAAYTTLNASADGTRGSCWNTGPNFDRWFTFTATTNEILIQLKTGGAEGTIQYPYIALWDSMGNEEACARYFGQYSDLTIGATDLIPGDRYYITVDNYADIGYRGSFTLCITDDIDYNFKEGAIELTDLNNWCSSEAAYTTLNASSDGPRASCWNTGSNFDRWFLFQATTNQVTIDIKTGGAEGTIQYPYIALWDTLNNEIACARYSTQYGDLRIGADNLVPGEWYYITVDNYADVGYRGSFTLCINDEIDYDFKTGALEIAPYADYCSAEAEFTTINATDDGLRGSCWNTGPNYNRWFRFQATGTDVSIWLKTGGTEGTLQYPYIALWDAADVQLACSRYSVQYSDLELVYTSLTPGNWYYITVDNYTGDGYRGSFTLCTDDEISYDFVAGAIELSDLNGWCSAYSEYSTMNATPDQARGSCWDTGPNYNRWFKFQAPSSDIAIQVRITGVEGSLVRPYVALWNVALGEVSCKRYYSDNGDIEVASTGLTPGAWYYVSVDNFNNVAFRGTFTLCITSAHPNDNMANAIEITDLNGWCSESARFSNIIATADQSQGSCWTGAINKNVWFKFRATSANVTVNVRTGANEGEMRNQQVALWTALGAEVGCNRLVGSGTLSLLAGSLTVGNWYYISVDDDSQSGTFTLCVDDDLVYPFPPGSVELTDISDWCSPDAVYTNVPQPNDTKNGSCWLGTPYKNKWFKFQATTSQINLQIKTGGVYGSMQRQQVALFNSTGAQVGCALYVYNQGTVIMQSDVLTIGQWYWFAVDDNLTNGSFSICVDDQVDYNYRVSGIELTDLNNWCSGDGAYSNLFATGDGSQGSCWTGAVNKNVWFKFVASNPFIKVSVKTGSVYGNMERQQVALWNVAGVQVACAKWVYNQGTITLQTDTLTTGHTYYISVDDDLTSGTFSLCADDNINYDYKAGAILLSDLNNWCSSDAIYSNLFATNDQNMGSCWSGAVNKNVWFKFQANTSFIKIRIKTGSVYGNMERQQVSLWNAAGVQAGCARWVYNQGTISLQTDTLTIGDWYWISVDDDLTSGSFSICADENIDYDYRAGAIELTNLNNWCSNDAQYSNLFATNDQNMGSCWSGSVNKNVWFRFNANTSFIKIRVRTGSVYGNMERQQVSLWNEAGVQVGCARWVYNQGTISLQTDTLTIGHTYYISVDDDLTSGSFSICADENIDYDYRAGAIELTNLNNWCSNDAQYSNLFATNDQNMGSCWSGSVNKNVWFRFQAESGFIKVRLRTGSVYGNMERQQLSLWNVSGDEVACARWVYNQGTVTLETDSLTVGNWYYISVDDDLTSGSFSLCIDKNPDYNYLEGAVTLTNLNNWCSSDAQYSNLMATDDRDMGNCWTGTINKNVWFAFQAPGSFIRAVVKTGTVYGTMQRQQLALWNAAGEEVACARWTVNQGTVTMQIDTLTAGNWYWISVDDDNVSGSFSLCIDQNLDYDYKAGAVLLTNLNNWCSTDAQYSNLNATADQNMGSCWGGAVNKNVWFTFQAIKPHFELKIRTGSVYGTMQRQQAAIWNASGTQLACGALGTATGDLIVTVDTLTIGKWYWISVDDNQTSGSFSICVKGDPLYVDVTGTNITCFGFNNGTALAVAGGGTPPYTYSWSGPGSFSSTLPAISGLIPGLYTVIVRDALIKTATDQITILEPAALSITTDLLTHVSCSGIPEGSIEITPSGGTTPYSYAWTGPGSFSSTDQDIFNLTEGNYSLALTDANSCTFSYNATILVLDITPPTAICQNFTVYLNGAGTATITALQVDNGSNDACGIDTMYLNDYSFTCADIGNNVVILTVRDVNGNSNTCNSTVTVQDTVHPVALCKDITVQLNPAGVAVITPADVDDGSNDACGIALMTLDQTVFTCTEIGPNLVTLTVTDNNGNTDTCQATVTIEDNIAPTASCNDLTIQLDASGNVSITPSDIDAGSTDACGIALLQLDKTDFTCSDVGVNLVTLTVTDNNGNVSICTADVTVEDNIPPVAVCNNITTQLDATGNSTILPADINNGSSDACGIFNLSLDITDFTCADIGPNVVTLTVTDVNGNSSTCNSIVTVSDTISPIANCQDIDAYLDATGNVTIAAADVNNGSSDACGIAGMVLDVTDFTCADIGPNTLTLTVTDNNGNTDQCTATVTVIDTISPVAVCQNINTYLDATGNITIAAADINNGSSDACGIASMTVLPNSFTCANVGPNNVILTVTDNNGNTGTCNAVVTVEDNVLPVAVCQNINAYLDATGNVTIAAASVNNGSSDACGIASMVLDITDFTCADVGPNTVTLTVTDNNGNTDQCTATVTVIDTISPVAVCQAIDAYLDAPGNVTIAAASINNGSSDACGIASMVLDITDFACADVGPNTVTLTVTDNNGNTDQCTATVMVIDTISPVAACQDINAYLDATGNVTIAAASVNNGSSDACGIASMVLDVTDFTCADVGTNVVTLTVNDLNGNSGTCNSNVTVSDTISPTISCPADKIEYVDASCNFTLPDYTGEATANDNCGAFTVTQSPIAGTLITGHGTVQTITLTANDGNGNTTDCNFSVTLSDTISPTISCPADKIEYVDASCNFTIPDYAGEATVNDNCGAVTVTQAPIAGTVITGQGTVQIITLTADDGNGNTAQCTFDITLSDTISPTITCPADKIEYVDASCNFTIPDYTGEATANDNCGAVTVTQAPIAGTTITGQGTVQIITLTAEDGNGNNSQCTFSVTLNDTISPTISCPADKIEYVDASCNFTLPDYTGEAATNDNCSTVAVTQSPIAGTVITGHGTTQTITLIVDDGNGNTAQCSFIVTLDDTISLTISCPLDKMEYVDANCNFTIPDYTGEATIIDNCASVTITQSPISGTVITGHGTLQTIMLTADDGSGNIAQCTFNVTLNDTILPTISCPVDKIEYVDASCNFTIPDYTGEVIANDNCGSVTIIQSPVAGAVIIGQGTVQTITMTANDGNGNITKCTFSITLSDSISPTIICPSDMILMTEAGECGLIVTSIAPQTTDNCNVESIEYTLTGASTGSGLNDASGELFNEGMTTVTYKLYDAAGNADSCSFNVTVIVTSVPPDTAFTDRDSICAGDGIITLSYSGGAMPEGGEAQWYSEPTFTNNIGNGNDLVIPAPFVTSIYYVRFEGDCDTTAEKAVTVYAKDMSVAPVSADSDRDSICPGDGSVILIYAGGSAGAGASAQWYSDPLCTQWVGSGNNLAIVAPLVTTDYYVRFEGECDTTDVVMSTIYVHPGPQPKFIIQSDRLCTDAGDVLYVADGFVGSGFTWSITGGVITADLGDSIFIDWGSQVGDYQLTLTETTINGCISAPVILNVQLTNPTVELGADQFICEGEIATVTPVGTFVNVLWQDGSTGSSYTTDVSKIVRVVVYDENSCAAFDSVQVTVTGTPYVNIGNDTLLCGEQSLVLDAGNPGSVYEWSTGETSQTITVFKGAQEIWVFVTTEYGCSGGDTILIYRCSVTGFFDKIPNAFTPNEDNVNDTWYFDEAAAFPNIRIEIFDRWGKLVFRSEIGYPEPWDGRSMNGKEMPMDSYFYVIDPGDGSDQIEGTVTIIR